jgi:hypothetical protein
MLHRILAIFLIAAVVGSGFSQIMVYAGFKANQNYITKVLCENKSRPALNCNGHCYLIKKLRQAEEEEKKREKEDKGNKYQEALPVITKAGLVSINPIAFKTYPQFPAPPLQNITSSIFQPPKIT